MYQFNSRIRYSEVDSSGSLSLESLLDYFQDCSTFQSEDLGVGVEYLSKRHMAWVMSAWQIVVERYPRLGEKVVIGTIPYELRGFFGYRNFLMETEGGERLACANTLWTLMDMERQCPVKPTEKMLEAYVLGEKLPMDYAPRKIALPGKGGIRMETIEIRPYHLDTNQHVNNGQYIRIALESLPAGYLQGRGNAICQMRAEYKKQAHLGDKVYPMVYEEDEMTVISLNDREGEPYCVVELKQ